MSGMLWGALGGAAKAGMQVMDDRVKAQADERKRVQSIADRRAELDREMDRKIEYARSEKEAEAQGFEQASDGGRKIANERGAAEMERGRGMLPSLGEFANDRITPEMIADLPPEARRIYEREMGLTPNTALQRAQDRMTGGREVGAPGSVRKELTGDFNKEVDRDNLRQKEAARDARDAAREAEREASQARVFAQQDKIQGKQHSATLAAIGARGSGGGGGRDEDNTKEQSKVIAERIKGIDARIKSATDGKRPSQIDQGAVDALEKELAGWVKKQKESDDKLFPGAGPVVPQSTKTDNGATKSAAPKKGAVVDGWAFQGGDPNDQKNWKKQ